MDSNGNNGVGNQRLTSQQLAAFYNNPIAAYSLYEAPPPAAAATAFCAASIPGISDGSGVSCRRDGPGGSGGVGGVDVGAAICPRNRIGSASDDAKNWDTVDIRSPMVPLIQTCAHGNALSNGVGKTAGW